jgi:hypothetical protein
MVSFFTRSAVGWGEIMAIIWKDACPLVILIRSRKNCRAWYDPSKVAIWCLRFFFGLIITKDNDEVGVKVFCYFIFHCFIIQNWRLIFKNMWKGNSKSMVIIKIIAITPVASNYTLCFCTKRPRELGAAEVLLPKRLNKNKRTQITRTIII